MSIERTQSSHHDQSRDVERNREVDKPKDPKHDKGREQPKAEVVDRFRNLMQARGDGKGEQKLESRFGSDATELGNAQSRTESGDSTAVTDRAVQRKHGDEGSDGGGQKAGGEAMRPAELAALYQAQLVARDIPAAAPAAAAPSANPQALADLLERHVRQLAVSPGGAQQDEEGQVLLRLSDNTLPGTDLLLSRTENGWRLRADVRSRGSYDAIQQAAPQLAERFAARNLGILEVDSHYNA